MRLAWPGQARRTVVVTAFATDGRVLRLLRVDLATPAQIQLPADARSIRFEVPANAPMRVRVELARHRAPATAPPPRPARPRWRDDSATWMWMRWWWARRAGERSRRCRAKP